MRKISILLLLMVTVSVYADDDPFEKTSKWATFNQWSIYPVIGVMEITGYSGRSSWDRLAVSALISNAFMYGVTQGLKRTIDEQRPYEMDYRSFPSGHTAASFTAATILHKEYGQTRSPWFSVGGYALATSTGVLRVVGNRHWVGDVVAGAGIGIIATELGYYITELIYKDKGIVRQNITPCYDSDRPSFLDVQMGAAFHSNTISFGGQNGQDNGTDVQLTTSMVAGIEGAYFLNKHVGIGGLARMTMTSKKDAAINRNFFNDTSLDCGVYSNVPIGRNLSLGGKALAGYRINGSVKNEDSNPMTIDAHNSMDCVIGTSLTWRHKENYAWKVFVDYETTRIKYTLDSPDYIVNTTKQMNYIAIGGSFTITL